MFRHIFTVRGSGMFPMDMLRYDSCYPFGAKDVMSITKRPDPRKQDSRQLGQDSIRTVTLVTTTKNKCHAASNPYRVITPDRWTSFGWTVLPTINTVKCV